MDNGIRICISYTFSLRCVPWSWNFGLPVMIFSSFPPVSKHCHSSHSFDLGFNFIQWYASSKTSFLSLGVRWEHQTIIDCWPLARSPPRRIQSVRFLRFLPCCAPSIATGGYQQLVYTLTFTSSTLMLDASAKCVSIPMAVEVSHMRYVYNSPRPNVTDIATDSRGLTPSTPLTIIQPVVSIIFYNIMLFDEEMTFAKIVFEHSM